MHSVLSFLFQGAIEARNRDYANIVRSLNFVSKGWYDTQVLADEDADIRRKVSFAACVPISDNVLLYNQCSVKCACVASNEQSA